MPNDDERAGTEPMAEALRRFDPRWLPAAMRAGHGGRPSIQNEATDGVLAARLAALLTYYRRERRHIHDDAARVLGVRGRSADALVLRAFRRLSQAPPDLRQDTAAAVRAALRSETPPLALDGSDDPPAPGIDSLSWDLG